MDTTIFLSMPVLLCGLPLCGIGILYVYMYSRDLTKSIARQIKHDFSMALIAGLQLLCLAVVCYAIANGVLALCDWRMKEI